MTVPHHPDLLLDHVECHLRERPLGPCEGTSHAYLVEGDGDLSRVVFPRPRDDAEREAIAAILLRAALENGGACVVVSVEPELTRLDAHVLASGGVRSACRVIRLS